MHLTLVLHKLKELILHQPCKCNVGTAKLEFLGHSLPKVGISPCPVEFVIAGSQCLTDLKELTRHFGFHPSLITPNLSIMHYYYLCKINVHRLQHICHRGNIIARARYTLNINLILVLPQYVQILYQQLYTVNKSVHHLCSTHGHLSQEGRNKPTTWFEWQIALISALTSWTSASSQISEQPARSNNLRLSGLWHCASITMLITV